MKSAAISILSRAALAVAMALACCGVVRAGAVEWSDGRKVEGAVSLTSGKDLKLYTATGAVTVALAEVKAIRFKPEKEEMWEGFYFPNAGQATQVKTGEVYPIRYLATELTLADGKVLTGHLFTTVFYVETDETTEKVVVMAKQTGPNGSKLVDLIYPTDIRFDAVAAGSSQIDLSQAGFVPLHAPVVMVEPDLALPPLVQAEGKQLWTVPVADPAKLLFAVEAKDGVHVTWPMGDVDPAITQAVKAGLHDMQDFYEDRSALGSFAAGDGTDIYSLVVMKRAGKSVDGGGSPTPDDVKPWSLVMLRWKYDAEAKKVTLLNRVLIVMGKLKDGVGMSAVLKEPGLFGDVGKGQ